MNESLPTAENGLPTGMDLIRAERQRQTDSEGWTPEHDAEHGRGRLLRAAEAYEWTDGGRWPWDVQWWKPKDALRDLIRAGALYLAAQDVDPDAPLAGTQGAQRCAEKIDGILGTAHVILARVTPPAETSPGAVCPECVAGKHGNCDGTAWDHDADIATSCTCPDGEHR